MTDPEALARAIVAQLVKRSPALAIRFADAAQEAAAECGPQPVFRSVRNQAAKKNAPEVYECKT